MARRDYFIRNVGVPYETARASTGVIVGAGTIGSFTIDAIARLGVRHLTIWDGDKVESANIGTQGYTYTEVGSRKASAIAGHVEYHTGVRVTQMATRVAATSPILPPGTAFLITAVDSIESRQDIIRAAERCYEQAPDVWETVRKPLLIDPRMGYENLEVNAMVLDPSAPLYRNYRRRLFDDTQRYDSAACGATAGTGMFAAAIITSILSRALTNRPYPYAYLGDLSFSGENVICWPPTPAPSADKE
jgi:hypothetical protein